MPGHTKCCTCHAKSSQQTWRSEAPKCNPSQEIRWRCLLYRACHGKCIFADPLQMSHACHCFWKCHKTLTLCSLLTRSTITCACHAKRHLNVQKWSEPLVFLNAFKILTSKCASRRNWLPNVVRSCCVLYSLSRNVLRATTAYTFSTSQLPEHVVLWKILTWKCASRHNGVQFFNLSSGQMAPRPLL